MLADLILGGMVTAWVTALLFWAALSLAASAWRRAHRRQSGRERVHRAWLPLSDRWLGIGLRVMWAASLAGITILLWGTYASASSAAVVRWRISTRPPRRAARVYRFRSVPRPGRAQ